MGFGGRVGGRKGGRGECRRGLAAWAWREVGRKGRLRAVQDLRVREKRWGRGGGGFNEASRAQRTGNLVEKVKEALEKQNNPRRFGGRSKSKEDVIPWRNVDL
ncbi:hypothetical protein JHK86_043412 [Glycine max]|nr:hypothetical protein JHK86_043412 [Glycine max]